MAADEGSQTIHQIDLSFVSDGEIRGILCEYYRQASLACAAGAHVGSIALSGGTLEGLLTWALSLHEDDARAAYAEKYQEKMKARDQKVPPSIQDWLLTELIEVSIRLNLLSENAKKTAHTVKDFRNYIHPYNARKSSWTPDESLALIALRLVDKFAESLRKRLPPPPMSTRK